MGLLNKLKFDISEMIDISRELGRLEEQHLRITDISDKVNYNSELADLVNIRMREIIERLDELKDKWI